MGSKSDIILAFITALQEAKGANEKKAVLRKFMLDGDEVHNNYVKDFVNYVCNPEINLYKELNEQLKEKMKGFTRPMEFQSNPGDVVGVIEEILEKPEAARRGQAGDRLIQSAYQRLEKRFHPLLDLFILRSLKVGVGIKTINAVCPNLVPQYGYQRCDKGTSEKVQKIIDECGEALVQRKEDGMFLTVFGNDQSCITRNGLELKSQALEALKSDVKDLGRTDQAFLGECLIFDKVDSKWLPRPKGNGMLNGIIQTGEDIDDRFEITFICWDMVPIEEIKRANNRKETLTEQKTQQTQRTYYHRLLDLRETLDGLSKTKSELLSQQHDQKTVYYLAIRGITTESVTDTDQFRDIFRSNLQEGFEGVVTKRPDFFWYDGTAKEMLKFKAEIEDDFRLVELLKGDPNGKYAETIGSVRFQSEDGLIEFNCAGIKDAQRTDMLKNPNNWLDKIFSVRFNELCTSDGKPDLYSVTFPRIISEPRLDKTEASTYPEVLDSIEKYFETI